MLGEEPGELLSSAWLEPLAAQLASAGLATSTYGTALREAQADLDALDGLDAHDRAGEASVETVSPIHARSEAGGAAEEVGFDDAAERVLGEFGVVLMVGGAIPGETRTAAIAIYDRVQAFDDAAAASMSALLLAICLLALLLVQRLTRGIGRRRHD